MKYKKSDKIEDILVKMLKENTGEALGDSGGAYGRHYERNKKKIFENEPKITIDVSESEFMPTISTYHYLKNFLDVTPESTKLNNELQKYMKTSEDYYLTDMEEFIDKHNENDHYVCQNTNVINTYNGEEFLSQTLQYGLFHKNETYFIALQIHNGCDVRGGYTEPTVFELGDADSFTLNQHDFNVSDGEIGYYSDDGFNWYKDDDDQPEFKDIVEYDEKNNKLFNKKTKKEFVVSGIY